MTQGKTILKERHYAEEQILINHEEAEAGVIVVDMCHKLNSLGGERRREMERMGRGTNN